MFLKEQKKKINHFIGLFIGMFQNLEDLNAFLLRYNRNLVVKINPDLDGFTSSLQAFTEIIYILKQKILEIDKTAYSFLLFNITHLHKSQYLEISTNPAIAFLLSTSYCLSN